MRARVEWAAFARQFGGDEIEVVSAGTKPAKAIHPDVVEVMREKGINLTGVKPQRVTNALLKGVFHRDHGMWGRWFLPGLFAKESGGLAPRGPQGQPLENVRVIRDEIEQRVANLLTHHEIELEK